MEPREIRERLRVLGDRYGALSPTEGREFWLLVEELAVADAQDGVREENEKHGGEVE